MSAEDAKLVAFQQRIGVSFEDPALLLEALTHQSYANERSGAQNYERLHVVGAPLFHALATEFLYFECPNASGGELATLLNRCVGMGQLLALARRLQLAEVVRCGRGQAMVDRILVEVITALIAAIYLDAGVEHCQALLNDHFRASLRMVPPGPIKDPKTRLQELLQTPRFGTYPRYELLEKTGPEHDSHFRVGVFAGEALLARGEGPSRKSAEFSAAAKALEEADAWALRVSKAGK